MFQRKLLKQKLRNEIDMWAKIDAEIKQSRKDGMLQDIEDYTPANKHQV
jgi:hypothetical protein